MKVLLKKLYFEPDNFFDNNTIEPVEFKAGINLIIGEKSEDIENPKETEKMNGVGKSVLIETIDFCLFKQLKDSRISKIPEVILNETVYICLDLELENDTDIKQITIKRSRAEKAPTIIIEDDRPIKFEKVEEAKEYFEFLIFQNTTNNHPSLRSLLSILIRDEQTSYNNILFPYENAERSNFSELIKPHLYLFNFDLDTVSDIKETFSTIDRIEKVIATINKDFETQGVNTTEIKAYLNDLKDKVQKLDLAVEKLEPSEGHKQIHDEINELQLRLDTLIAERASREYTASKIKRLPKLEKLPLDEIKVIYNQYKEGLGDLVKKSFEQVLSFKTQIEDFQNRLMQDKLKVLQSEIFDLNTQIEELDERISQLYSKTSAKEKINDLTLTIREQREKNEKLDKLSLKYQSLEEKKDEKKKLKKKIEQLIEKLETQKVELFKELIDFEEDLTNIHEYIAGNKKCQFGIEVKDKKEYIKFDYRINLDGSSGINRIRTFIYDSLLLLNKYTSRRHLGFLIHDNIFASAGRDDMVKSLNYLHEQQEKGKKFQYIVTINKDEFESKIKDFDFNYKDLVRKELTRKHPFLKTEYKEI